VHVEGLHQGYDERSSDQSYLFEREGLGAVAKDIATGDAHCTVNVEKAA
jgi:hypothetical protein